MAAGLTMDSTAAPEHECAPMDTISMTEGVDASAADEGAAVSELALVAVEFSSAEELSGLLALPHELLGMIALFAPYADMGRFV